ncbi:outer membrane lipoprotein-sorting protein [Vibrio sp. JC009]|uniref:outer membrane lipoprotein-sorting protein n=1 Tax=Vibrio sp. JC009 TaxID=2912314 RepID=UPI0023B17414|nr:outer membrane lipoprotein-sorting protein [Vibrio sp. JC009]WED24190.1 outer membrane lipoprotein-sorting protein [Vibrio sp. JC009]
MRYLITVFTLLLSLTVFPVSAESAYEIVDKSDKQMRGDSSYSVMTMRIIRPDWTRSMSMKSWTKGQDHSLVLITAPAKDKGSASLKRYREMWNWIPGIERIIKIAPSMLSQSWMGSDFTNDDLINQSSIVVDYDHTLIGQQEFDNDQTWVIDAIAKPDAPVVWSKVRLWISADTYLQRKVEFYDEFGDLVNLLQTFDIKEVGGRMLATRMEMMPVDKPGQKTEMVTHEAQFDFEIRDEFFSLKQMQSLRD